MVGQLGSRFIDVFSGLALLTKGCMPQESNVLCIPARYCRILDGAPALEARPPGPAIPSLPLYSHETSTTAQHIYAGYSHADVHLIFMLDTHMQVCHHLTLCLQLSSNNKMLNAEQEQSQ